jgi:hypothetical protein
MELELMLGAFLQVSSTSPTNQTSFKFYLFLFCIYLLTREIPFKGKLRSSLNVIIGDSVLEFTKHFPQNLPFLSYIHPGE